MLFNSFQFLIFFPLVTTLYYLISHKFRWALLLVASCYFYICFKPIYILILFSTIVVDYLVGIYLEKLSGKRRRLLLLLSIVANIGALASFKYWNFLNDVLTNIFGVIELENPVPYLDILLPIGLSFHTFQALSYTFEVYRGNQKAEKHLGTYALYVMFYPQLVAGPIERPQNMIHQFYEKHTFDYQLFVEGLKRMLWGFFKKIVVADNLSRIVNLYFDNPEQHSGSMLLVSTLFFAFQIYCDFSGYSDIAIGSAQCMGFKLMRNFNLPYFSKSISEFWSRWHISLSTWFKDYLYIPLGGNRVSKNRWILNILTVFIISGLWHGANITFIIWGLSHGILIIAESYFKKLKVVALIPNFLKITATFMCVMFLWIFFRAISLVNAVTILKKILFIDLIDMSKAYSEIASFGNLKFGIICAIVSLFAVTDKLISRLLNKEYQLAYFANLTLFSSMLVAIILFGFYGETKFIYFQF